MLPGQPLANDRVRFDSLGGEVLPVWLGLAGAIGLAAWPLVFRRAYAFKALAWRAAASWRSHYGSSTTDSIVPC